jgi:hypothetical protein
MTYCILRFYRNGLTKTKVIRRGLTREEADNYCASDDADSRTASSAEAKYHTELHGPWFDGLEPEE